MWMFIWARPVIPSSRAVPISASAGHLGPTWVSSFLSSSQDKSNIHITSRLWITIAQTTKTAGARSKTLNGSSQSPVLTGVFWAQTMPCRRKCGLRLFLVGLVGRWMISYGLLILRDYLIITYYLLTLRWYKRGLLLRFHPNRQNDIFREAAGCGSYLLTMVDSFTMYSILLQYQFSP